MSTEELQHHYPEISRATLVEVDVVDNGEHLGSFGDECVDFVVACHVLEHCEDPIAALGSWVRIVRSGGVVFLAVPNKDLTFDRHRPITRWDHVLRDWTDGPKWSRASHYREWVELVETTLREDAQRRKARELMETHYSIHFHVWSPNAFHRFLNNAVGVFDDAFALSAFVRNGDETLVVLRVN